MSAILGIFDTTAGATDAHRAAAMLAAMARRGAESTNLHLAAPALLGASCFAWERAPDRGAAALMARDEYVAVVADATLYYRADLERKLRARGMEPRGRTPAELALAAYRAWGRECPRHLEGDFAFILWDARTRTVLAARDFAGKRPLFHARIGDSLVIASEIAGILAHPECPRDLDVAVLAEEAAVLTGSRDETCWRAVRRVAPGHHLAWRPGERVRTAAYWTPPTFRARGGEPFEAAAGELRALLCDAVTERLSAAGRTVVCLSGGWDSPSVYAAGRHALRGASQGRALDAVSVSFPPGDPGREDELIERILAHWGAEATWIRSDDIPPLDGIAARAAERDEPFPHLFEAMNRAMAGAARARGARVMLDGNGGDQLFAVSSIFLADLFRAGRWRTMAREWRASGGAGLRALVRDAVLPALPEPVLRAAMASCGREVPRDATLDRTPPAWFRADFLGEHHILERERRNVLGRAGRSLENRELAWQLTMPLLGRMAARLASLALEMGVEHRSPLCDERIVRFAATRPTSDRRSGRETKRLLRSAMAGLLPDDVLAPRRYRTGVPIRYLSRAVRQLAQRTPGEMLRAPLLSDLGIVEPAAMERAWAAAIRRDDSRDLVALLLTLEVEMWLRAHAGESSSTPPGHAARRAPFDTWIGPVMGAGSAAG